MKKYLLFNELAKYYDYIYSWKNYKKETKKIKKIISKYKKSERKELLDVACGTGQHLKFLKNKFSCVGIDMSKEMLKIAKRKCKRIEFKQGNMLNFSMNKKFDVVTCLFGSISAVKTYSNVRKTIKNFNRHLKKDGIIIVEGFIDKASFKKRHIYMDTYQRENIKIVRMGLSKIKGNVMIAETHYLIGTKNRINHFSDRLELGLFDIGKFLDIMKECGFKSKFLKRGLMEKGINKNRGIYIGIKNG